MGPTRWYLFLVRMAMIGIGTLRRDDDKTHRGHGHDLRYTVLCLYATLFSGNSMQAAQKSYDLEAT